MLAQMRKVCPGVAIHHVFQYALDPVATNLDCSSAYYV
jgi:hypothetical protein